MYFKYANEEYHVEIVKKMTTKNTYIRVKDGATIYVTTNVFVSDRAIAKLLKDSEKSIIKMLERAKEKKAYEKNFYFRGKKYDIVYTNDGKILLSDDKVYVDKCLDLDKWYRKQAQKVFKDRLDYNYAKFSRKIPHPQLTIRKMTTRWGVCNTKDGRITLNLELIKKDEECLDYVINHELSHLIEANHSKRFWQVVAENFPDYKRVRSKLKKYD